MRCPRWTVWGKASAFSASQLGAIGIFGVSSRQKACPAAGPGATDRIQSTTADGVTPPGIRCLTKITRSLSRKFECHDQERRIELRDLVRHTLGDHQEVTPGHPVHGPSLDPPNCLAVFDDLDDSTVRRDGSTAVHDRPDLCFGGVLGGTLRRRFDGRPRGGRRLLSKSPDRHARARSGWRRPRSHPTRPPSPPHPRRKVETLASGRESC